MRALVICAELDVSEIKRAIRIFGGFESLFRQQRGFVGAYMLVSRETGRAMLETMWANETDRSEFEASSALQAAIERMRDVIVAPLVKEEYEVAVQL